MKRSGITRRTPLSKARLKAAPTAGEAYATAREAVSARAGGLCECCGTRTPVALGHAHHRRRRSAGRDDGPANLIWLCLRCHEAIHAAPRASLREGRLISRHDHRDPCQVPVALRHGWVLLADDGRAIPLPGWTPGP